MPLFTFVSSCCDMQASWSVDEMLDDMRTWSVAQRYLVAEYADRLRDRWGNNRRAVRWQITLRLGSR